MTRFIHVPKLEGYSETVNVSEIQRISKCDEDGDGCRVVLKDGTVIYCTDSKRTIDSRLSLALEG